MERVEEYHGESRGKGGKKTAGRWRFVAAIAGLSAAEGRKISIAAAPGAKPYLG